MFLFLSKDSWTFVLELKAQARHNAEKTVWNNGLCKGGNTQWTSEHGNLNNQ
jgi:hypothetical protein